MGETKNRSKEAPRAGAVLWLTRTAILIALLVAWQWATNPLGITLLTGSGVNLILIAAVTLAGLPSGLCVALISPVLAFVFGIPKFLPLVPFIAAGNAILVLAWHFASKIRLPKMPAVWAVAAVAGALLKFAFLYFAIVRIAIPVFGIVPEQAAPQISVMFGVSQLITALIGGAIAVAVLTMIGGRIKPERIY
ncbi:MAG: hypothetical protein LBK41_05935 [Clostridiales bacterium]|jgi:hypothetical protein|nr:hypothetical protein [Clostridiales bacterium]